MSKFIKGSLITAGIFMAVGLILCMVGGIVGGKKLLSDREFWNTRFERVEDVLDNLNINIGDGFYWGVAWDGENPTTLVINGKNVGIGKTSYEVDAEGIHKLALSLGAGTFEIEEKDIDDGTIDISIKGIGDCSYSVNGDTLQVEGFKNVVHLNGTRNAITLSVPRGIELDDINIEIGAGIMEIASIKTPSLAVELGAGELSMKDLIIEDFSVGIGAGRMEAEDMNIKNADFSVNMGECIFDGSISGDMNANCDMGNMELEISGEEEDHNYEINCSAGNISMEGFNAVALSAQKTIDNHADSDFTITCNMGNISIDFEN